MTDDDLEAGVSAGIITRQQLDALRALADQRAGGPVADEERFRVLGGFNDILVAIGLGLLIAGFLAASGALGNPFVLTLVALVSAWGLAELFTRRLRLALPSILLSLMFCGTVAILAGATSPGDVVEGTGGIAIGLGVSLAALVHFWRFRVPVDVALATAGLVCAVLSLVVVFDRPAIVFSLAALLCGIGVFAFAMTFDTRDPLRRTRQADIGFWLHLLAAPLIVHPIISGVVGIGGDAMAAPILVLALFSAFALVALIVDRRALLVSGLGYAGYSLATLFERLGGDETARFAITLIVLAVIVLAISAGWRRLRALILPAVPLGVLASRLPPAR